MKTLVVTAVSCAAAMAAFAAQREPLAPVFPGASWETRSPAQVGLDEAVLDQLAEHVGGRGCVVRDGYLVYGWGDIAQPGDVASAFKSLLSTLLFFAVQEGLIEGPEAAVADHEPRLRELAEDKDGRITWKHLAQQTSGYGLAEAPGEAYSYNDYAISLYYDTLMDRVFQAHGNEVLARYLGEPLQFEDPYTFEAFGPRDRPGRLGISLRDFARFGHFILHSGRWRGEELLGPHFIDEMLGSILAADTPITGGADAPMLEGQRTLGGGKTITSTGPGFYSFNWWRNGENRDGERLFMDGPDDLILAGGHGGRRNLWIFPSHEIVVAWNDSHIEDHDDSPGNPGTLSNQAVRLIMAAVSDTAKEPRAQTKVAIDGERWLINGEVTYPGAAAEGLLMNARMVNATFEDRNRDDFDPDANTANFIAAIPDYLAHGIRAFTFNLQGGYPGYEGAMNSAFEPDGSLRPGYMERIQTVLDACNEHGTAAILGLFYQRQDGIFECEEAIRNAVRNAMGWIREREYRHVVVEIANEYGHGGFGHDLLRAAEGQVELLELARSVAPLIPVSTSGQGNGTLDPEVAEASDFMLIHFNHTPLEAIPDRIGRLRHLGRPIVCNEDIKTGEEGAEAARVCVAHGISWGLMELEVNQKYPFEFRGAADDSVVYAALKKLTTPGDD